MRPLFSANITRSRSPHARAARSSKQLLCLARRHAAFLGKAGWATADAIADRPLQAIGISATFMTIEKPVAMAVTNMQT